MEWNVFTKTITEYLDSLLEYKYVSLHMYDQIRFLKCGNVLC